MKFILGKKLDMTQVWKEDNVVGVTRVQAGPCVVVQVKSEDKDGYSAVQVGFGERQVKNIAKPQQGHMKKAGVKARYLREFRIGNEAEKDLKIGDVIDVSTFEVGDNIQVTGVSKGKGFQGVVKRHGFHGQDKTHGTKDQLRMPGSIGATGPAHVFKGQKMPGRMGNDQVTVKNSEVVKIDKENNILLIKGAVPGARNGLVLISGEGELVVKSPKSKVESDNKESRIKNQELRSKDESKTVETKNIASEKENNKEVKDKDIEEVVVEAKERVDGERKEEKGKEENKEEQKDKK